MSYSQVWWPIPGIHALHLIHPKCTHTAVNTHKPWTHTRSSGQPFSGSSWGFGALLKGTSVVVLKAERVLYIHSPHLQFLPDRDLNSHDSLTCPGPAGVPWLATRCLCMLSTWLVVCAMCSPVYCLLSPILFPNHCFSCSSCVSSVQKSHKRKLSSFTMKTMVYFCKGCDVHMFFVEETLEAVAVSSIAKRWPK